MTTQETDHLTFAGHEWDIIEWRGELDADERIPTNEELGIATEMESTANASGRVDTFSVGDEDALRLVSMRVTLASDFRDVVPDGARVEPVIGPFAGQSVRFVFDDHPVRFTGELLIARDASGPPAPGQPLLDVYATALRLRFDHGLLQMQEDIETRNRDGIDDDGFI